MSSLLQDNAKGSGIEEYTTVRTELVEVHNPESFDKLRMNEIRGIYLVATPLSDVLDREISY